MGKEKSIHQSFGLNCNPPEWELTGWPPTQLDNIVSREGYTTLRKLRQKFLMEAARKLEHEEVLDQQDRDVLVAILREYADNLPSGPPRKRGRPPKLNPSLVAIKHACMTLNGMSSNKANELLAERYGVSVEAIFTAVKDKKSFARAGLITFIRAAYPELSSKKTSK